MFNELFIQVAFVILVAGALSLLADRLRQPLIVAYILTGIIVGPSLLGVAQTQDVFSAMAEIGIAFLLFIVGLNLNWRNVHDVGRAAVLGGVAQVVVTSLAGLGVGRLLGFDLSTSAFLAVAFSFSSTIIIVKLLSDKEDLERLYGRVAVGILIVQDVIAMFLLLIVAALRNGGDLTVVLGESFVKGVAVLAFLYVFAHVGLPRIFKWAARSQELLFLITIAWCFGLASALQLLGFGIEIGALLAGISLAGSGFQHEIEAKIRSLRDFFLVIFFIVLGTQLSIESLGHIVLPAAVMSLYIIIGNPLIAMGIMRFLGYHPRSAFMTATTVGQISEFSFILLSAGIMAGLVEPNALPLATLVGMITITVSSYIIAYNERIYDRFSFLFSWMEGSHVIKEGRREAAPGIVLFGYHRMGATIHKALRSVPGDVLVVDFNPMVIEELADRGIPAMYGDAGSEDVLKFIHAERAKMLISTIPDMNVNYDLLDYLRAHRSRASIIVTARQAEDAARCYALGASYVIIPSVLGAEAFSEYLAAKKTKKVAWQTLARRHMHHKR